MQHRARKRFGQNFLHDPGVIQRIVDQIYPQPDQHLVEIGPGQGALTKQLLDIVGKMEVIELDRDLIPILQQRFGSALIIHQADALQFDFCSLQKEPDEKLRVVGNLPYNISTPLLFHLMEQSHCIRDMHFMLQKEVVERITAGPGNKHYGRLGIMLQYYCQTEMLFTVGPGAFNPAPKVDSAIVRLTPHAQPPVAVNSVEQLAWLVQQAFTQRRKTLRNNLKGIMDAECITSLGIDPALRPERLSLADFAKLANAVPTHPPACDSGNGSAPPR